MTSAGNFLVWLLVLGAGRATAADPGPSASSVGALVIGKPSDGLKLDPFYEKHIDLRGFPIVSSRRVSDFALREAAYIVDRMLADRPDLLAAMAKNRVRLAVMSVEERTTDVPEHRDLTPAAYWDRRARGLGATRRRPAVSCAEENLLCLKGDPYSTENILVHEFAHAIHEMGVNSLDPTFQGRLEAAFKSAQDKGLWKDTYAATNPNEYWAEAVQSWFDTNRPPDSLHNDVNTREELKDYDPEAASLIQEVFDDNPWRYQRPDRRGPKGHLAGFDRSLAPSFSWRKSLRTPEEKPAEPRKVKPAPRGR